MKPILTIINKRKDHYYGDPTGVYGDLTGISGSVDECEILAGDRAAGIPIEKLIRREAIPDLPKDDD